MPQLRPSRILREIRAGQTSTILKLNMSDPRIVELAGLSGASGVWLCNEHVPNDWMNMEHQIRAAKLYDMDTIVRVNKGGYSEYVKPFECDATGIMVPHITSVDEARNVVDMVRCHPLGRKALDAGNMDGLFCQVPLTVYAEHCNTEKFVILQIESPEALEIVDQIAAVPGYDMLLFGAGDFSHRIGKLGQATHPEVVAARKKVAAAALKHGKHVAVASLYGQKDEVIAEGTKVFTLGADVLELGGAFKKLVNDFTGTNASAASDSVYANKK
ncbi:HpcH/HpaI aldolase family protein [Brevifollis gellanilyticus]|uniref:Siderophore biosynthesis protein SbnG n=1 Tax=Brevifollis gellanilyticus TaxID=748831 RepID=A0A512M5E5_9BACT|nr:aldolase/citrate lyase family protein [Brevifollis gellanilyticus]GEP41957.1 siderophore biosynthesis protein SbnG [Brevifollis gellanilyticus]